MKLYKTSEPLVSENYPYGYSLRTTKTDYLEFNKKHGFRHCSYTINPKTRLANKPKKATYCDILILGRNEENNHVQRMEFSFYDQKDIERIIQFFSIDENFNFFTCEQIEYIYLKFMAWIRVSIHAQVVYCASKSEDLIPLYDVQMRILVDGAKEKGTTNIFKGLSFNFEKINSFKVEGYQPFKVTSYGV